MIQPSTCYIEILFTKKPSLNKQGQNSIHKQSKWKASWRKSLRLDSTFKASCYIEILFTKKNSLNKQGRNSIHEQSKWKASWRNSLRLDSTFKASCYIAILFTKNSCLLVCIYLGFRCTKWVRIDLVPCIDLEHFLLVTGKNAISVHHCTNFSEYERSLLISYATFFS